MQWAQWPAQWWSTSSKLSVVTCWWLILPLPDDSSQQTHAGAPHLTSTCSLTFLVHFFAIFTRPNFSRARVVIGTQLFDLWVYYRSPLHNPWVYLALPFGSQGASCPPLILPDSDSRKNNHPKIGGGGIQSIATAVYHFLSTILTDLRENHILCRHDIYWSVKLFICASLRQLTCFARQQILQRSCVFLKYGNYTEQRERESVTAMAT